MANTDKGSRAKALQFLEARESRLIERFNALDESSTQEEADRLLEDIAETQALMMQASVGS